MRLLLSFEKKNEKRARCEAGGRGGEERGVHRVRTQVAVGGAVGPSPVRQCLPVVPWRRKSSKSCGGVLIAGLIMCPEVLGQILADISMVMHRILMFLAADTL